MALHSLFCDQSNKWTTGIEPAYSAWEADALPLNYVRIGQLYYYTTIHRICQGETCKKLQEREQPKPAAPLLYSFCLATTVFRGCHAEFLLERPHEVGIIIPAFPGDLLQGIRGVQQQPLGMFQLAAVDVVGTAYPERLLIDAVEIGA